MREMTPAILLTLATACAMAQTPQPAPAAPASTTPEPAADTRIHLKGPGVTAPELLSLGGTFDAIDKCKKLDGDEQLLITVDRTGTPRMIRILKGPGNGLDAMALHVLQLDKFKPGTFDGAPATVAVADDMKLQACWMEKKDESGEKRNYLQLRAAPEQTIELMESLAEMIKSTPHIANTADEDPAPGLSKIGGDVTPPVLIHRAAPGPFGGNIREGICYVSIVVDIDGKPQNPQVVRSLSPEADESALKAVRKFRFIPAKKNGTPVPVMITVEVNFRMM
ncbi:MAG: energy transducer TonB [Terracidiphilus sp.]